MYSSILIAEYLISLAKQKDISLNMTKVQKLLYISYGNLLATKGRLISDESPKAWPYGPVFPKVHKRINVSEIKPISDCSFDEIKKDLELTDFLNLVINKFSKYSATQLSDWSHLENSPWDLTTKEDGFKWNATIPNEFIIDYFSKFKV